MSNKKTFKKSLLTTSMLAGLYGTSVSHAMIVDESTLMSLDFSNNLAMPTILPAGTTGITGTYGLNASGDVDYVVFTDLPTGIQTFNLVSTATMDTMNHVLDVYQNGSMTFLTSINLDNDLTTTFQTLANFDGSLDLRFVFEGNGFVTYSVELQPIPVPPAALLFASGLGALGAAKARRKANRRSKII